MAMLEAMALSLEESIDLLKENNTMGPKTAFLFRYIVFSRACYLVGIAVVLLCVYFMWMPDKMMMRVLRHRVYPLGCGVGVSQGLLACVCHLGAKQLLTNTLPKFIKMETMRQQEAERGESDEPGVGGVTLSVHEIGYQSDFDCTRSLLPHVKNICSHILWFCAVASSFWGGCNGLTLTCGICFYLQLCWFSNAWLLAMSLTERVSTELINRFHQHVTNGGPESAGDPHFQECKRLYVDLSKDLAFLWAGASHVFLPFMLGLIVIFVSAAIIGFEARETIEDASIAIVWMVTALYVFLSTLRRLAQITGRIHDNDWSSGSVREWAMSQLGEGVSSDHLRDFLYLLDKRPSGAALLVVVDRQVVVRLAAPTLSFTFSLLYHAVNMLEEQKGTTPSTTMPMDNLFN